MQSEPGVHARFHYHPYLNGLKSREAGVKVYDDKLYVEILVAGQDKQTVNRPAQEKDKVRFHLEWAAFLNGDQGRRTGTPIAEWPRMMQTPAMAKMLESIHIFTVQDLAACTDEVVPKLGMGGYKLREDAKRFLELAKGEAQDDEARALREKNADLEKRLAELEAKMAAPVESEEPARRKAGRPRKAVEA